MPPPTSILACILLSLALCAAIAAADFDQAAEAQTDADSGLSPRQEPFTLHHALEAWG